MSQLTKKPNLINTTCDGSLIFALEDEMLSNREINCVGEINKESVQSLIMQLRYLDRISDDEITLFINSQGGEVTSGLALYDVMMAIKAPIRTVCIGQASSMGALLFIAGNK